MSELSREALEAIGQRPVIVPHSSTIPITVAERDALVAVALAYQDAVAENATLRGRVERWEGIALREEAWKDEAVAEKEQLTAALREYRACLASARRGLLDEDAERRSLVLDAIDVTIEPVAALLAEIEQPHDA